MRGKAAGVAVLGAMLANAGAAHAGINEVSFGVLQHNICITNCKNANKEDGPVVVAQVDWDSPHIFHWAGAPRPYAIAAINVSGDTSFVAAGLDWRLNLSHHFAVEPGIGLAIHDGEIRDPYPNGSVQSKEFSDQHVLLGSRVLFQPHLGLTYSTDGPWEAQLFYSHLSHGQILAKGRNQGMDQLGIRIGYRFGH